MGLPYHLPEITGIPSDPFWDSYLKYVLFHSSLSTLIFQLGYHVFFEIYRVL